MSLYASLTCFVRGRRSTRGGFERRVAAVFAVRDDEVLIVRLFYGGQDSERAFTEDGDRGD